MKRKLLIALMGLVTVVSVLTVTARAQTGWFNPAWNYRTAVTISNPAGSSLSNFQVQVALNGSFNFAQAKSDGSDVRVTASDGVTSIPFWIESWNASNASAILWVQVPSIPSTGTTVYLYYGNPAASSASNGNATFNFFDDFQSWIPTPGYFQLSSLQTVMTETQTWENVPPHTLSVVEANLGGYTYWGYYGLVNATSSTCGGIGLAFSNDLVNWTKYTGNPVFPNGRWASVHLVSGVFYMAYTQNYCESNDQIELATSTDGINWTDVETLVPAGYGGYSGNIRNQNSDLFLNPNDGKFYLYWYSGNDADVYNIKVRSATSPLGLTDASSDVTIQSSNNTLAAPNVFYYNGTYFLSTETLNNGTCSDSSTCLWNVNVFSSAFPTSGFTPLPGNPVVGNDTACMFQHQFGTTLHSFFCKRNVQSNIQSWVIQHASADLTAPRIPFYTPDPTKWTASGGTWLAVSDTQQDGSTGMVAQGATTTRQILSSTAYTGTDYVVQAYGKQMSGDVWGLGARVQNPNTFYSINLYDTYYPSPNLYAYSWVNDPNPAATLQLGSATVGQVNPNTWYQLMTKVHGSAIDVYKDGVLQISTSDSSIPSGGVALYGEAGSVAEFNDLFVRQYASTEPVATLGTTTPEGLSSLTLNPGSVLGGNSSTGTVSFGAPAPSGGIQVSLSSSNPSLASVPTTVTVPAGSTSATFTVSTSGVATTEQATITASYNGAIQSAVLTVTPFLTSLTLNPVIVIGGNSSTGTVQLAAAAPSGGIQVSLSSSNSSVATVPSSVTVAAGATSAGFVVTTTAVSAETPVTISASYGGASYSPTLTVTNPGGVWLNSAWSYRSAVTIANPGGTTLTNYQVNVALNSSFNFALAQSNGGDVQFTAGDGATLIPFWIESWKPGQSTASLWVNVPSIPSGGTTVYLYYGNPAATSASSGTNTFNFFDDFESGILDSTKWTASGGTWTVVSATQQDGTVGHVAQGSTTAQQVLFSSYTGGDYVLQAWGEQISGNVWGLGVRGNGANSLYSVNLYDNLNPSNNLYVYSWLTGLGTGVATATLGSATAGPVNANTWYQLMVKVHSTELDVYLNGTLWDTATDSNLPSGDIALYGEAGTVAQFNNVFVRQYASIEPVATVGSATNTLSLNLNPTSVVSGTSSTGTVTLGSTAPAGGVSVTLTSSDPSTTVPATVTVAAGATTATFTATTTPVGSITSVTISATYNSHTQTATLTVNPGPNAVMQTPIPGSTLSGSSVTFTWSAGSSATAYWVDIGTSPGGNTLYQSGNLGNVLTKTVNGLPTDGSTVYVTLYSLINGSWVSNAYTYTAYSLVAAGGVLTTPTPGSTLSGSSVTFTWSAGFGATAYWVDIGTSPGGNTIYQSGNLGNVLTKTVNGLPTDGSTVYVTLYSLTNGSWVSNAYTYTAYSLVAAGGVLTTPTPGSTLTASSVTFTWSAGFGATAYWVDIGTSPGGNTLYQSGNLGNVLTKTVNGLPTDGSAVYVTLYSLINGSWVGNAYTYTAFNWASGRAVMQTPTPGSTLTASTVTFTWSAGSGATAYWLDIGNVAGGNQYYQSGNLGNVLTTTVNSLPTDGSTVNVTLYSLISGSWVSNAYTYTAFSPNSNAVITTPTPLSTLNANSVTFNWTAGTGATSYWLDVGNVAGGNQWYQSGNLGNVLTTTPNLPADGSTLYATLYSLVGGQWVSSFSTTYKAAPGAVMQSPAPYSTLSGASATFTWSAGTGITSYELDIGTTYGGNDIDQLTSLTGLTTTVNNLPANGSTIYVTLYSQYGAQSLHSYYSYVSGP